MRLIVVGDIGQAGEGFMSGIVYFRFPVENAARQKLYALGSPSPAAPGDYNGADEPEVAQVQGGEYVEVQFTGGTKFPEAATVPELSTALEGIYQTELASWQSAQDLRFRYYGSSWDGSQTVNAAGDPPGWTITSA